MDLKFRQAQEKDYDRIAALLGQIALIHHQGRPDIFKAEGIKYSKDDFLQMLEDKSKPVLVVVDSNTDMMIGYAFCRFVDVEPDMLRYARRYLFVDDLCIDEVFRGRGIGLHLMEFLKDYARKARCGSIELNVWECNRKAIRFYEKNGFVSQRKQLELKLDGSPW